MHAVKDYPYVPLARLASTIVDLLTTGGDSSSCPDEKTFDNFCLSVSNCSHFSTHVKSTIYVRVVCRTVCCVKFVNVCLFVFFHHCPLFIAPPPGSPGRNGTDGVSEPGLPGPQGPPGLPVSIHFTRSTEYTSGVLVGAKDYGI